MRYRVFLFLILLILSSIRIGEGQIDDKTLIQILNFSDTVIQDGEIRCLFYQRFPTHTDDVGVEHAKLVGNWEKQLRENPQKSRNPQAVHKQILRHLEQEKRYGGFRGSDNQFQFTELNLNFQIPPLQNLMEATHAYRLESVSCFDNYPSLGHIRFFNGGDRLYFLSNGSKNIMGSPPNQFANDRRIGYLERREENLQFQVITALSIPPSYLIDEKGTKVSSLERDGETVYVITHYPVDRLKVLIYARLKNGLPEVFKEEFYYQSESPLSDAEGYWLRLTKTYSDFQRVDALNITVPKMREEHEFRGTDGFMRRHTVMTIKEMDFNLGFPVGFFDWNEAELNGDNGKPKRIRGDAQKGVEK